MKIIPGKKSLLNDISHTTDKYCRKNRLSSLILKTESEIDQLRESAHLVRDLLNQLDKIIKPGVNELDIASFCENYLLIRGAEPILKTGGIYPHCVLISRNNIAFHGIPKNSCLKDGDVVTVDVVLLKNGWFGDGARTYEVGRCAPELKELIQFSRDLIYKCVDALKEIQNLSVIGRVICRECELHGYGVIEQGAGHGIGRSIHEDPLIFFTPEAESIPLVQGMVFTIEPVVTITNDRILEYNKDGEAYVQAGNCTVQCEHMVAVNDSGIEILTDRSPLFK